MEKFLKKIVIIHDQPLEIFPPVINFINYLSEQISGQCKIYVLTSETYLNLEKFENKNVFVARIYKANLNNSGLRRIYNYILFAITSLIYLLKWRPGSIFYYESHSALPVFLYFKLFSVHSKLFIHYHEYMTPCEYSRKGMRLVNYAHKKEKYLYEVATWISHTNEKRMQLFLGDNGFIDKEKCRIMPNYPPKDWSSNTEISNKVEQPLKIIYIGSFGSFEDLYIKEVLTWVKQLPAEVVLDIYSFNVTEEIRNFISALGAKNIGLKANVDYHNLPGVLKGYNIGLILYKATSLNFKFNAPNKLFEYLATGLDVWFPEEMLGCYPYIRGDAYPKVVKVDFKNLNDFDYQKASNKTGMVEKKTPFFCETVFASLVNKLAEC